MLNIALDIDKTLKIYNVPNLLISSYDNYDTYNRIFGEYSEIFDDYFEDLINHFLSLDLNSISDYNYYITRENSLFQSISYYQLYNNPEKVIEISEKYLEMNQLILKITDEYNNNQLSELNNIHYRAGFPFLQEGRICTIYNEMANAYKKIGEEEKYLLVLKKMYNEVLYTKYSQGMFSLRAMDLARFYLKVEKLDSTEKYLQWAFHYKSPFAEAFYDTLKTYKENLGIQTPDLLDYLTQLKLEGIIEYETAPNLEISTNCGKYNFNQIDDNIYFIFLVDESCYATHRSVPATLNYIKELNKPNIKSYIITELSLEQIQKEYFEDICISNDFKKVVQTLKSYSIPSTFVIQNGKILYKSDNVTEKYEIFVNNIISKTK